MSLFDLPYEILEYILFYAEKYLPIIRLIDRRFYIISSNILSKRPLTNTIICEEWIIRGDLKMLKWAELNNFQIPTLTNIAIKFGQKDILEWLLGFNQLTIDDFTEAAKLDNLELFERLYNKIVDTSLSFDLLNIYQRCVKYCGPKIFNFLLDHPLFGKLSNELINELTDELYLYAVKNDDLELMKTMKAKNIGRMTSRIYEHAVRYNHRHIVKWLMEQEICYHTSGACSMAAYYGHFELLKWLLVKGFNLKHDTVSNAARMGHMEILKWLEERRAFWDPVDILKRAVCGGHLGIVKYIHNPRIKAKVTVETCEVYQICTSAVRGSHFEVLQWLHKNGYSLTAGCFTIAVTMNNFEILEWLLANNCPRNKYCVSQAIIQDRPVILKWIFETGYFRDEPKYNAEYEAIKSWYNLAVEAGNIGALNFLYQKGFKFGPKHYIRALRKGKFSAFRWLIRNGSLSKIELDSHIVLEVMDEYKSSSDAIWKSVEFIG